MASDLLRRQYDEMVSDNATLTAQLAAVTAERDALVEDNTALRWKNGDSYDTWPLAPLREPEYFKVGDRELEKTAVCRCCDSSWAWAYVSREGYCLHCVDGRADLRAERDALRARAERYERALYGPVPTGGMETLSGNECRLCCADAKPDEIDMHEDDCPLRRAALAAAASEGE